MSRRIRVLATFALIGLSFLLLVSATRPGAPPVAHPVAPFHGDEVLIYQNGFCQVIQHLRITVVGGVATIEFPNGIFIETLHLTGIDLLQIDTREVGDQLAPGDHVIIGTVTKERFEGQLVSLGSRIILETDNGTKLIESSQVVSIDLVGAAPLTPGRTHALLHVEGPDGVYNVTASYILRGLSWSAHHRIEVEAQELQTWIKIAGSPGMTVDRLKLVSGAPRFVMWNEPGHFFKYSADAFHGLSDTTQRQWAAGSLDEYHEYTLNRPIDLLEGREFTLKLFETTLELAHEYAGDVSYYGGDVTIQHRWIFPNKFTQPLPSGVVSFYRDGRFIGQDNLQYLPREEKATLVSGDALDLPASVESHCVDDGTRVFTITVTNRKDDAVEAHLTMGLSYRSRLAESTPRPTVSETNLSWQFTMDAGDAWTATGRLTLGERCY